MTLEEKIEQDYKAALKARNTVAVSTLRMLKAEANTLKLDRNLKTLDDEEVLKIVKRQIRQHVDSIEQFKKGNRNDLVEQEKRELEILTGYMPEQLSDEELTKIICDTIAALGAATKRDTGKVMKEAMEKVKGRADGKRVSRIVSDNLA
jgi:uncharacterized protein YqeY